MFAEMMYKYAVQIGKVKPKAQFIVFNCAKYAENPQLILSQLFGHVKGAFTGADQDKPGLIEKLTVEYYYLTKFTGFPGKSRNAVLFYG